MKVTSRDFPRYFAHMKAKAAAIDAMRNTIGEQEPVRPSTRPTQKLWFGLHRPGVPLIAGCLGAALSESNCGYRLSMT
jgi:hypothetical protein